MTSSTESTGQNVSVLWKLTESVENKQPFLIWPRTFQMFLTVSLSDSASKTNSRQQLNFSCCCYSC